jgi:hypothetical protein
VNLHVLAAQLRLTPENVADCEAKLKVKFGKNQEPVMNDG